MLFRSGGYKQTCLKKGRNAHAFVVSIFFVSVDRGVPDIIYGNSCAISI